MADEEKILQRDFPLRGIGASTGDDFSVVRGTMSYKDEFGGWGKNISRRPYELNDGRGAIASRSEALSVAEAMAVKDQQLCIHGNYTHECPYRKPNQATCRVSVSDGKPMF